MNFKYVFILTVIACYAIDNAAMAQRDIKPALFSPQVLEDGTVLIDDFETDTLGELPRKWYNRDGEYLLQNMPMEERETYYYKIMEENRDKFVRYNGTRVRHMNYPLINKKEIDIYETPVLSWKWRVHKIPKGADESKNSTNDSAASIYVVFDMGRVALFKKVPKTIKYAWSSTLKEGTVTTKLFGNQQIVIVESGKGQTGKWMEVQRNIVEDYERLFGDSPPEKPLAILIMSDGDSTGDNAIADYDDIMLKPEQN